MNKKKSTKIGIKEYIKAVKTADRQIQLSQSSGGWPRTTNIHKNKKRYNRQVDKNNHLNEL